ncbi:MAG TPA: hypothetical protein VEL03_00430 [Streptosporangiaceae bacterium]|nr:hypothetical protein [Streptosporangiaceae bacterium]
MNWLWLNIPLDAIFFLAVTGIPLWLVLRHPDVGPAAAASPVAEPAGSEDVAWQRELAGAAR